MPDVLSPLGQANRQRLRPQRLLKRQPLTAEIRAYDHAVRASPMHTALRVFFMFLISTAAYAQADSGTLTGTIGDNDRKLTKACHADNIVDNLLAERSIQPMVVVFPNGNSSVTADAVGAFPGEGLGGGQTLKLLWLGCGNKDGLIRISQGVHSYFKENGIPHVWHVEGMPMTPRSGTTICICSASAISNGRHVTLAIFRSFL